MPWRPCGYSRKGPGVPRYRVELDIEKPNGAFLVNIQASSCFVGISGELQFVDERGRLLLGYRGGLWLTVALIPETYPAEAEPEEWLAGGAE